MKVILVVLAIAVAVVAQAPVMKSIYAFKENNDGSYPIGMTLDPISYCNTLFLYLSTGNLISCTDDFGDSFNFMAYAGALNMSFINNPDGPVRWGAMNCSGAPTAIALSTDAQQTYYYGLKSQDTTQVTMGVTELCLQLNKALVAVYDAYDVSTAKRAASAVAAEHGNSDVCDERSRC